MLPDWNGGYRYQTQYCILRVPLLSSQYSLTMSDSIYIYICTYAVHSNVKKNVTACAHIFLTLRRCPTSVLDSCTSIGSGIATLLLFVVFEYWTFFWLEQLCLHIVARKLQTLPPFSVKETSRLTIQNAGQRIHEALNHLEAVPW